MFIFSLISGLLTTMNVWVSEVSHIRFSYNDLYMSLLMSSWMILLMAMYYGNRHVVYTSLGMVVVIFVLIRRQVFITQSQYIMGMIPHHSMAVHMSKMLKRKDNTITPFLDNIIKTQEGEINFMRLMSNMK
jgi:hypothetical protein